MFRAKSPPGIAIINYNPLFKTRLFHGIRNWHEELAQSECNFGFQKHLIKNELPFSQINIDLLKEIMILEETQEYVLRGKTGWAVMNEKNIGWLVGYLEKGTEKYAYVINVESADEDTALFVKSRIEITRNILEKLGLI